MKKADIMAVETSVSLTAKYCSEKLESHRLRTGSPVSED